MMTCGRGSGWGGVMMTERDSVATSLSLLTMMVAKYVISVLEEYVLFPNASIIAIISYRKMHNFICK